MSQELLKVEENQNEIQQNFQRTTKKRYSNIHGNQKQAQIDLFPKRQMGNMDASNNELSPSTNFRYPEFLSDECIPLDAYQQIPKKKQNSCQLTVSDLQKLKKKMKQTKQRQSCIIQKKNRKNDESQQESIDQDFRINLIKISESEVKQQSLRAHYPYDYEHQQTKSLNYESTVRKNKDRDLAELEESICSDKGLLSIRHVIQKGAQQEKYFHNPEENIVEDEQECKNIENINYIFYNTPTQILTEQLPSQAKTFYTQISNIDTTTEMEEDNLNLVINKFNCKFQPFK